MDNKNKNSVENICPEYHSLSNDNDIEEDRAPVEWPSKVSTFSCQVTSTIKSNGNRYTDTLDSAFVSFHPTSKSSDMHDKFPVQCSEVDEGLVADFAHLKVGKNVEEEEEKDEGIYSISDHLSVSDRSSVEDCAPIEVDLSVVDEDGDSYIHIATIEHMPHIAIALVYFAFENDLMHCLDIQNNLWQTALHLAVLTDQADVVRALVECGADVTLQDHQGNTALHIACRRGNQDAVYAIVKSFGDNEKKRNEFFEMRNCEGLTCLHVASEAKEYHIMGHLFAKGADVNIGDGKSGRTALHYAVERKDLQTVTLLLTHSEIDVECRTFKGETPAVIAFWRNYTDILKKLRTKGAYFDFGMVEESDDEEEST